MCTLIPCKWSANFSIDSTSPHIKWDNLTAFWAISLQKKLPIVRIIRRIINNLMNGWLSKIFGAFWVFFLHFLVPPQLPLASSSNNSYDETLWHLFKLFKLCMELSFQAMHGTIYSSYHSIYSYIKLYSHYSREVPLNLKLKCHNYGSNAHPNPSACSQFIQCLQFDSLARHLADLLKSLGKLLTCEMKL